MDPLSNLGVPTRNNPTDLPRRDRRALWLSLAAGAASLALTACNTVEGAGEDLEETGENIGEASRDVRN